MAALKLFIFLVVILAASAAIGPINIFDHLPRRTFERLLGETRFRLASMNDAAVEGPRYQQLSNHENQLEQYLKGRRELF